MLTLVATPLGNLADMPPRAAHALQTADVVACEDTRTTGKLLQLLGIKAKKLISYHQHNEAARATELVAVMQQGQQVALVSDSGVPGISDPGATLVRAARQAGVAVTVVGAGSAVAAVAAGSGLAEAGFVFVGFAPRAEGARQELWRAHSQHGLPLVVYESPHRVGALVESLLTAMGDQPAWLGRELTKMHEEWLGPTLASIATQLAQRAEVKGECALIVANPPRQHASAAPPDIAQALAAGHSVRAVADELAAALGISRNAAYAQVQAVKKAQPR